jgi:hypothetical protein
MGEIGRDCVMKKTIKHVVLDLLTWYKLGIDKKNKKNIVFKIIIFLICSITVPLVILLLGLYDFVVFFFFFFFK